ncbi:MAG: ribonuclease R [Betaproteobacteria bacterium]|nr:ribonuclease R [Betaproteobacteria bacterium]
MTKKNNKSPKSSVPAKPSPRRTDPHLAREQAKYENPVASRELILEVLEQAGVPMNASQLATQLHIGEAEMEGFSRRLAAMEREAQIMTNRHGDICLVEKLDLIPGRIQGHPDGFGFLIPDDGSDDLFLGPKQMQKVLDGDRAMVRAIGIDRKGRREASIIEVIERKNSKVVGRLFVEHNVLFVVAENRRISQDILVEPGFDGGAKPGQVVMVELVAQPAKNSEPVARVIEVLGNYADPGMEIEIALRKHDLPYIWPSAVEAMEKKVPKKVTAADMKGRADLRDYPFVTIDGETAKDFDDAVFCEKQGKGYRLLVAIADVSHYVKTGDALDKEARLRGNSVYFPRRVIPMLPEALSNEMCSLKPDVDRLALVCEMSISPAGEIKRYEFMEAVFHSAARLTYTKVAKVLYSHEPDHGIEENLIPHLHQLDNVFQVLLAARNKRGAIDFDTAETVMMFDDVGKIEKIVPTQRNDAHRLIEECMLAANVCAANFLLENEHAALYRIHAGPSEEKLEGLRAMLKDFALQLPGGKDPKPADYSALLKKIKDRPDAPLLQTVLLRSMKQAVYSPDNIGHFGLAYDAYTHFTSPIRRYPDLLTHRAIKAALKGTTYDPKEPWDQLGMQCSATERRADEATRDVTAWLKCYYMKDRLGEEFAGTISGVTNFGIFVTLDEVYVEGLVHISELGQDYFKFDLHKHQIVGERTNKKFQLADRVNIKVARVDIETSKIDFVLTSDRLKKAVVVDEASDAARSPWTKPAAKGLLEKKGGGIKPSPAPLAVAIPARDAKVSKAPVEKKIISFDSSNPPTTPMAGLDLATLAGKKPALVRAKPPVVEVPAPKGKSKGKSAAKPAVKPAGKPKGKNPGALLSKKKK